EPSTAAGGGGIGEGPSGTRTESNGAQPRRDGRCGAPARSARDAVELPGIPRGPEMGIDGRRGGCEFVGKRLTEHDGARPAQARDALRVLRRHMVPEEARSVRGTDPRRLDDVLYSVGNAVERPPPAPCGDFAPGGLRLPNGAVGEKGEKARRAGFGLSAPRRKSSPRLYGRDASPPNAAGQIMQTEIAKRLSAHSSSDCWGLHSF